MGELQLPLFGNAMYAWDVKLGNVGSGRKIQGAAANFGKFYTYKKNDTAQLKNIRFH